MPETTEITRLKFKKNAENKSRYVYNGLLLAFRNKVACRPKARKRRRTVLSDVERDTYVQEVFFRKDKACHSAS